MTTLRNNRWHEGNDVRNFIEKVREYSHIKGVGTIYRRCWYILFLNVTIVLEFLIFIVIEFHVFALDIETTF